MSEHHPVLIVGGGGAGLTTSMLLAEQGVESLLISSLPHTSDLPKAHVINQRALEVMEDVGCFDEIEARSTPPDEMSHTAFYAGFAKEGHEGEGRCLMKMEAWGAGVADELWRLASPRHQLNLPQIRLEPILRERAEELSPGRVRFNHELTGLTQDAEGVTAKILDKDKGEAYTVTADYAVAADGGRTVPGLLGIGYEGLGEVAKTATMHASADFSEWATDPDVLIRWHISPEVGAGIVLVPMGPKRWGPDSEEWVIHLIYPEADPRELSDEQIEADMRHALGIGSDLPFDVHKITRWTIEAVLAESFSNGRVFLIGDAAHRHPPTGGLGLNSAIHDAQNIAWKIAAVLDGRADASLLGTYEAERRPVVARNAQRSLENAANHIGIVFEAGLSPEQTPEQNRAALDALDAPESAERRTRVREMMRRQSMEFGELNVEWGYGYESDAVVGDGTDAPPNPDDIRLYTPSTRPGSPLPHAWIDDDEGNRRPIKDLVGAGRFLLIAGEEGGDWCEAARDLTSSSGFPLDAVRIGHAAGDLFDPRSMWARNRGIEPGGAVLVRPDRFVGWRAIGASEDPRAEIAAALEAITGQPVRQAATSASA